MELYDGMGAALTAAREAGSRGEVPIGAALFKGDELILAASNTCNADNNPLQHAEMRVLQQAMPRLEQADWRQSTLYVTLEPCPMCMGALMHSHLGSLVFGAYNLKWGCCGTVTDFRGFFPAESLTISSGIRETECADLLAGFFASLR